MMPLFGHSITAKRSAGSAGDATSMQITHSILMNLFYSLHQHSVLSSDVQ